MALIKKKTRKAIGKNVRKAIRKHGPTVVQHVATGLAAGLATYIGAEGEKGVKKLKKAAESLPGGKKIAKAVAAAVPLLQDAAEKIPGVDVAKKRKGTSRSKKSRKTR